MRYTQILLNPFGGSESSSPTTSKNTTATGSGKAATDSANAVQTGDSSIAVGSGAKYQESGSISLDDLKTNTGTITFNDPEAVTNLAKEFAATTQAISSSAASSNLASNNTFLQGLQELALSQQTGGLTPVMKTFLWLAVGGIALLAFIFRKRSS